MVLQVPNTPSANDIGRTLKTIFDQWPDLDENSVAHVFGEHKPMEFGPYTVPYIEPQRVQNDTWVRILIAKDAITTGWDCPRAEVMVSFRTAKDQTYIAQMLGRMVRTPLARRIPGNDKLNAVECLLPKFDKETAENIVKALGDSDADTPPMGRILINPVEMKPNPDVTDSVWEKFAALPSQTRPQRAAKPAIRLTALAHELASDGLLSKAGQKAHESMHKFLNGFIAERQTEFDEKRASVMTVEGRTIIANLRSGTTHDERFRASADDVVVGDAFRRTARIVSPDIARTFTMALAKSKPEAEDDLDEALLVAREDVAALHLMENLQVLFDAEAKTLSDAWFDKYREAIKKLTDDRQDAYRQIVALSTEPQDVDLARPLSRFEPTRELKVNGAVADIPTFEKHLLCGEDGLYPAELRGWENSVLSQEMKQDGFLHWYRNPDRPSQDSLGIAYAIDDDTKIIRPDFLFFSEDDGEVVVDIVDPHGHHLADALPKLKGLAKYAGSHANVYRRIEAVAKVDEKLRVLNLLRDDVRRAIVTATNAEAVYRSEVAGDYL